MSHRAIIRTVLLILPAIFCMYSVVLADGKVELKARTEQEPSLVAVDLVVSQVQDRIQQALAPG